MRFPRLRALFAPRTALVLGSGGARGIAHLAVLEDLAARGTRIDLVVGSSIGAVAGALWCCGTWQRLRDDVVAMRGRDFARLIDPTVTRGGLVAGGKALEFLARYLPDDTRLEDLSPPLVVVATDLASGRPVVLRRGHLLSSLRASFAIPGIFTPVRHDGHYLVDGGVAAALPVDIAAGLGATAFVAVNLSPPLSTEESVPLALELPAPPAGNGKETGWWESLKAAFAELAPGPDGPPGAADVVLRSLDALQRTEVRRALAARRVDVLVEPAVGPFGVLDFARAAEILATGRAASAAAAPALARLRLKR